MLEQALIEHEALQLPAEERAVLADKFISSLSKQDEKFENAWAVESEERMEAYRVGEISATDSSQVISELRKSLSK